MTNKLPRYINCKTNTEHCEYIMHKACRNACPYVISLGIDAMVVIPKGMSLGDVVDRVKEEEEFDTQAEYFK